MVKMIMTLPTHVDAEKFCNLTVDVIKGRYGKDGFFGGVEVYASRINDWAKVSKDVRGLGGKNTLYCYEIKAQELDPVIISTLEELGELVGMKYSFATEEKILRRDWWKPNTKDFQTWRGNPYYDDGDARKFADEYWEKLEYLDPNFKSPSRLEFERKFA